VPYLTCLIALPCTLFDKGKINSPSSFDFHSLLRYWRNSLADRDNPKLDPQLEIPLSRPTIETGCLSAEATRSVYLKAATSYNGHDETLESGHSEESENQVALEVVVCPLIAKLKFEHGVRSVSRDDVLPLLIPAKLDRSGQLQGGSRPSWIPRELLEPMVGSDLILGELDEYDQFLTSHSAFSEEDFLARHSRLCVRSF
jgi:hypothetical protein